ncbi:TAXI family TRAP transporter solute-binding subunit [Bogoriella caseilytica]|nr:TAXI family TRAP transporter solute-binding subunit [Bogoriella caseilytica]
MKIRVPIAISAAASMLVLAACNGDSEPEDPATDDATTDEDTDDGDEDTDDDADDETDDGAAEGDFITNLTFASGGTAGTYYPLAGELSTIFADNTEATVDYVESGGSIDNLGRLLQGQAQLILTQNDTAANAVNGTLGDDLDGVEVDNVGWIANLYPEAMHIIVLDDSEYQSIEDLNGATIAVGDVGSGTRAISDAILEHYDIDYTPEETDFGSSTEMLADGQIDATMFVVGVPVAGLVELTATRDARLISLDEGDAEDIADGGFYESYSISSDSYDFLDEDVTTISVFAALAASTTEVSEELAYEITAALFEYADQITVSAGENIDIDEALLGIGDIPLHPGAERYYDEQGIELP